MTTTEPVSLTNQQLSEVLKLIKGADSVELQLTVPDVSQRSAVAGLETNPADAPIRQVASFDTPNLTFNEQGVVMRARWGQGQGDDSVIKR